MQTLQTWCNKPPVWPDLARPPCQEHRPNCAQTLQTSRPCPKPTLSKVWAPCIYACTYHLTPKTRTRIHSWSKFRVSWPKPVVAEVVPTPPDHAGWLSIRLEERAAPLAGPHYRPIDLPFGSLGVTCTTSPKTGSSRSCPAGPKLCALAFLTTMW